MRQQPFASLTNQSKRKTTRRKKFLGDMEQVVPWSELVAVMGPHDPTSGRRGRSSMPLLSRLRVCLLQ